MNKLLYFVLLVCSSAVFAGAKGLDVIIVNIGDAAFYTSPSFYKFLDNFDSMNHDDCWERYGIGDGFSGIYHWTQTKLPPGINEGLAKKIWNGDPSAIKVARKIMHVNDGAAGLGDGYHGMYIIKPEGDKLSIMAIGANSDLKKGLTGISKKLVNILINQEKPEMGAKAFEQSLCKVSKPFNIGFSL